MQDQNVSITVPVSALGVALLKAFTAKVADLAGGDAQSAAAAPAAPSGAADGAAAQPRGRGRPPKAQAAAPAAPASAPVDDGLGLGGDAPAADDDELGLGDAPAAPAAPAKKLTLADDVIPAFRAALDRVKGDKGKLAAVLADYGVKSVQALPEPKFAEVVAKLAKLK